VVRPTVEEELLKVRRRHRSWQEKLAPLCLGFGASNDLGGRPKSPMLSS